MRCRIGLIPFEQDDRQWPGLERIDASGYRTKKSPTPEETQDFEAEVTAVLAWRVCLHCNCKGNKSPLQGGSNKETIGLSYLSEAVCPIFVPEVRSLKRW